MKGETEEEDDRSPREYCGVPGRIARRCVNVEDTMHEVSQINLSSDLQRAALAGQREAFAAPQEIVKSERD